MPITIESQTEEASNAFWHAVVKKFGEGDPGKELALCEAIGRFREAQSALTKALSESKTR